jgi:hypothetical protein
MKIKLRKNNLYILAGALLTAVSFESAAACYDFVENYGKVSRIYPQYNPLAGPGTFFNLKSGVTNALCENQYYHISTTTSSSGQSVYRSLHDLLVEAAKYGWTVQVRTTTCGLNASNSVEVEYIVVDY